MTLFCFNALIPHLLTEIKVRRVFEMVSGLSEVKEIISNLFSWGHFFFYKQLPEHILSMHSDNISCYLHFSQTAHHLKHTPHLDLCEQVTCLPVVRGEDIVRCSFNAF